jgi:type IV pilus assembly protein PilA
MNKKQAFSLVELMVVIAIIGILSAIAVPSYKSYVTRSRVAEMLTIAESIQPRIAQKYNEGASSWALSDLGLTSTATTYVSAFNAASSGIGACTTGTLIGGITVTGNAAALGVSGTIILVKAGCISNDVISWRCGVSSTTTAGNNVFFPSDCQATVSPP